MYISIGSSRKRAPPLPGNVLLQKTCADTSPWERLGDRETDKIRSVLLRLALVSSLLSRQDPFGSAASGSLRSVLLRLALAALTAHSHTQNNVLRFTGDQDHFRDTPDGLGVLGFGCTFAQGFVCFLVLKTSAYLRQREQSLEKLLSSRAMTAFLAPIVDLIRSVVTVLAVVISLRWGAFVLSWEDER